MKQLQYAKSVSTKPHRYTLCGLDNVFLTSGYQVAETGYGAGVVVENMDDLHRAIGDNLARCPQPLNGEQLRFLRHEMDLTQAELGRLLRVTDQTVARWEKNEVAMPGPEDMLVRAMYLGHAGKKVDVWALARGLREPRADGDGRLLFGFVSGRWQKMEAEGLRHVGPTH